MRKGTRQNKKKRRRLFEACCALLLACQLLPGLGTVFFVPQTVQAAQMSNSDKSDSSSTVGIEEYDNGKDYTGWYTVLVRVVDDATGDPVDGIYVTLNSKEKGEAGHGPNINGITEYVTNTDGYLEFRIYPAPITYAAIVSAGQKGYAALEQYIGALDKDYTEVVLRLKKEEKKDDSNKDNSNKGDNNKDNNGNGGNNNTGNNDNKKPGNGNTANNNNKKPDTTDNKDNKDNKDNNKHNTGNHSNKKPGTGTKPSTGKDDKDKVTKEEYELPGKDLIPGTEDDVTVKPDKDKDGNNNSGQDKDGNVTLPDGGTVIIPTKPDKGNIKIDVPGGTVVNPDGTIKLPEGDQNTTITLPGKDKILGTEDDLILHPSLDGNGKNNSTISADGTVTLPDGGVLYVPSIPDQGMIKVMLPEGATVTADGTITIPEGTKRGYVLPGKDAVIDTEDDVLVDPFSGDNGCDNSVLREDGSVLLPDGGTVTYADGTVITVPSGTVVLPDGTIIYPETAKYISFWDCYLHWLILVIAIVVIVITGRRIHWLNDKISEIRQMQENDSIDKERIAEISAKQKKTGIIFHMILDMVLTAVAAIAYYIIKAHCIADLPVLMILAASDVIFVAVLIHKEKKLASHTKEDI